MGKRTVIGRHRGCGGWIVEERYGGRISPEERSVWCQRCHEDWPDPDEVEEYEPLAVGDL